MQASLFQPGAKSEAWRDLSLPDGRFRMMEGFLAAEEAWTLFGELQQNVSWRHDDIRIWGKTHKLPRLQQWFGDPGNTYTWSGIKMGPTPWLPALERLRNKVEAACGAQFNTVLANLYRDGQDTVGWHADNEADLGPDPVIASVSLGAERDFILRHSSLEEHQNEKVLLPHGSLLLMTDGSQANWKHALPRRKRVVSPRINLTFRQRLDRPALGRRCPTTLEPSDLRDRSNARRW